MSETGLDEPEGSSWRSLMPVPLGTALWANVITRPVVGVGLAALPVALIVFAITMLVPIDPRTAGVPWQFKFATAWLAAYIVLFLIVRRPY